MTPRLPRAYRATRYEAEGISVFVGRRCPATDGLLARHGARAAVFVTAWNPMSRRMPEGWNARMQRALVERLRRRIALPAEGSWRGWREKHILVVADPALVRVLAYAFRQRATVVVRRGQVARLHMVRRLTGSVGSNNNWRDQ